MNILRSFKFIIPSLQWNNSIRLMSNIKVKFNSDEYYETYENNENNKLNHNYYNYNIRKCDGFNIKKFNGTFRRCIGHSCKLCCEHPKCICQMCYNCPTNNLKI